MNIKKRSSFKDIQADHAWFNNWVHDVEQTNGRQYERIEIQTSLGKTHVWDWGSKNSGSETLVIFPGARTTTLFWDLDKNLDNLGPGFRIFMVETNGLPNLSDGATPDIRSLDYGHWANEVLEKLNIASTSIAGASFGGLICMKLSIVAASKVKAAYLLNPGCLQPFSLSFKNLYYNILPIVSPSAKNVSRFLDAAVLCKPEHTLSAKAEKLLIDYEVFALKRYQDNTQKPYDMGDELLRITVPTYLLEGDKDLLFPFKKSIENARRRIKSLQDVIIFTNVGHGIETYPKALQAVGRLMREKMTRNFLFSIPMTE